MAWDEARKIAEPIVESIKKFDDSSSALSKEMIALSKRIYWLTWFIAFLTVAILFLTAWMGLSSKVSPNSCTSVSTSIKSQGPSTQR
ncbi:MAG: hypothetical protein NTV58_03850 [Deltaproteobacteria bacterium]|nr:hypothetical protein [Deltaproteobacteria bacterium]